MLGALLGAVTGLAGGAIKGTGEALSMGDPNGLLGKLGETVSGVGDLVQAGGSQMRENGVGIGIEARSLDMSGFGKGTLAAIQEIGAGFRGVKMEPTVGIEQVSQSQVVAAALPQGVSEVHAADIGSFSAPTFGGGGGGQSVGAMRG